ncbi:MAG: polysaccharide deacetylase family protein [Thalassobaculaceae bacterium]|nr:polysaccharide deacetylase family protein [Thalassobaculaceae bacterium]
MTDPRPGMDHALYPYSAINRRPALSWPEGNGLAFTVVLHLEFWRLDPPKEDWRDPRYQGAFGNFYPDYTAFTQREYGNRVGIFRVLDLLDRFDLKLTVPANAAALERYPGIVERLKDRKVEFVAAGTHADRMITSKMDADAQRWMIDESIETVERLTGTRPTGWAGPGYGESEITAGLLAEAGLEYVMDWPNDDQPYMLRTEPGLVSIPRQPEWDDGEIMWLRKVPRELWSEMAVSAFEGLYEERAAGRYFALSLHPWVVGQTHRIRYLAETLEKIAPPRAGVWQTTAGDVARHFRSQIAD